MTPSAGWTQVTLGDVVEFPNGKNRVPGRCGVHPVLTFKGLKATGNLELGESVSEEEAGLKGMTLLRPGDTVGTNQGHATGWILKKVGYVDSSEAVSFAASTLQVFRPLNGRIDCRFLYHYLAWPSTYQRVTDIAGSRTSFTSKMFKAVPIPLPPIEEQRRIATILDAADGLRTKRRDAVAKLDALIQSVFVQMFGDPMSSTAHSTLSIGEVAEVVTGNTPPCKDSKNYGAHLEWIKSDNIDELTGVVTAAAEYLSEFGVAKGRTAPAGAVLVVCIAGSPKSIGRVGLLDRPVAFNQQINAIVPRGDLLSEFLFQQLRVGQRLVQRASTKSMKGMVSKTALSQVELMIPPVADQTRFVEAARLINRQRGVIGTSSERADTLFASLRQRAFRGEL